MPLLENRHLETFWKSQIKPEFLIKLIDFTKTQLK